MWSYKQTLTIERTKSKGSSGIFPGDALSPGPKKLGELSTLLLSVMVSECSTSFPGLVGLISVGYVDQQVLASSLVQLDCSSVLRRIDDDARHKAYFFMLWKEGWKEWKGEGRGGCLHHRCIALRVVTLLYSAWRGVL